MSDELPTWISTAEDNLFVPLDSSGLYSATDFLGQIRDRAGSRADFVAETSAGLLSSDWSGRARDSFESLRTNLVTDLDECASQAESATGILEEMKELISGARDQMSDIRGRIWHIEHSQRRVSHESEYSFYVRTEEELQAVQSAIADGAAVRDQLRTQIELTVATFDPEAWRQIANRWLAFAYGYDQQHPAAPGDMIAQPFNLPDQARDTWVLWVDGDKLVTTPTPVSDLEVRYDEATDMFVIDFGDRTERFLPGTAFNLHTNTGEQYLVYFSEDRHDYQIYDQDEMTTVEWETAPPTEPTSPSPLTDIDIVPLAP